jgi:hypothetical protein
VPPTTDSKSKSSDLQPPPAPAALSQANCLNARARYAAAPLVGYRDAFLTHCCITCHLRGGGVWLGHRKYNTWRCFLVCFCCLL